MSNEIKKIENNPVNQIWRGGLTPTRQAEALSQIEEVQKTLTPSERGIVKAQSGKPIKEYEVGELQRMFAVIVKVAARDLGCNIENDEEFNFKMLRMYEMLLRYYPTTTLEEIKLSFELLSVGELDNYLPKNSNGEPRKEHYQSFNVEFLTRILNAYKLRSNACNIKARKAVPLPVSVITERQNARARDTMKIKSIRTYLYYYNTEKIEYQTRAEWIWQWLEGIKQAKEYTATDEDKAVAQGRYRDLVKCGKINRLDAMLGVDDKYISILSDIVMTKAIKQSFDSIKDKQLDVVKLTKFETYDIQDNKIISKF